MAFQFKLNDSLRPRRHYPASWVSRVKWVKPEPLYVLSSYACNDLPEMSYFQWNGRKVQQWIAKIGFPQYRNTFDVNLINGRLLLLVDANALCRMNITDFQHITTITAAIRDLYQIELILHNRCLTLPPRLWETHYKLYKMLTGPTYARTKRSDLWTRMHLVQPRPPPRNHWHRLHVWLQHQPPAESHRVAYTYMEQLYKVKAAPPGYDPSPPPEEPEPCGCIPPCECEWQLANYRQPWTLSCLAADDEQIDGETDEQPVDNVDKSDGVQCSCIFPHECHWKAAPPPPDLLSVIRSYERLQNDDEQAEIPIEIPNN